MKISTSQNVCDGFVLNTAFGDACNYDRYTQTRSDFCSELAKLQAHKIYSLACSQTTFAVRHCLPSGVPLGRAGSGWTASQCAPWERSSLLCRLFFFRLALAWVSEMGCGGSTPADGESTTSGGGGGKSESIDMNPTDSKTQKRMSITKRRVAVRYAALLRSLHAGADADELLVVALCRRQR